MALSTAKEELSPADGNPSLSVDDRMLDALVIDRGLFREKTDDEIGRLGVEPLCRLIAEQCTDGSYVTADHDGVTLFAI